MFRRWIATFTCSPGHKLYGPTGIGILYVKEALLQEMPPWEGGGSMIATVSLSEGTTWTKAPMAV
ncbi:cysteine desulfurase (selenocysteine lyase) [Escherichia coli]|uniref:Cysteine desulfurase (Selenocysteine lyase) n=1 Tax=Escherichia coli TaxID=562 RepID=A0A2X1MHD5_ECOLX|nr:cysteine desulfurase (selenocysteine lyase) [Escherichia coli]